jgi:2-(1,2-epoxy-1,2-dihydrophenyl)acetyl-CoA isomerase
VKLVGLARARDLLLTSREVGAVRAYELGLLTEVVPDDELLERAHALVEDALRRAPQSYGLTKRLLLLAASADVASGLIAETIAQSLLIQTDDHAEGLQAAREDRSPSFRGR